MTALQTSAIDVGHGGGPSSARPRRATRVALGCLFVTAGLLAFLTVYGAGWIGLGLVLFLPLAAVAGVAWFVAVVARRRVSWGAWRGADPAWSRGPAVLRSLVRSAAWLLIGSAAHVALPRSSMTDSDVQWGQVSLWTSVALLVLREFVPTRRASRFVTVPLVVLAAFCLSELGRLAFPPGAGVELQGPVRGEWIVLAGGDSALVNHHFPLTQQRYALDLAMPYDHRHIRRELADYPAFGKRVLAPVDGHVTLVVGGRPDQPLGMTDVEHPAGNHLVIRTREGRYVLMAHLRADSIQVDEGQRVVVGDRLAEVGNSGNSTEPHLHIQVQTGPRLFTSDGRAWADVSTVPIGFAAAGGAREPRFAPVSGDRLHFPTTGGAG